MFAYIPARGGSKRIPRKNIRTLGGKPLLLHVIEAVAGVPGLQGIAVSSEDPEILSLASVHPKVTTLGPRLSSLAGDQVGFIELLQSDARRFMDLFKDSK